MLDKLVADTIAQQALIDECAEEAFPAEVRPGGPLPLRPFRRRRLNRDGPSAEDGRPADPAPPPEGAEDEPPEPPQAPPQEDGPPPPQPPTKEKDRQESWNQVPANVRREIEKFHVNMGHLSTTGMVRMLRRAGAKAEVLKWAELFKCQACQDTMKAKHPRPTRFADDFAFNIQVSTDVFTVHDIAGAPHHMLNLMCEGTCYQVVA